MPAVVLRALRSAVATTAAFAALACALTASVFAQDSLSSGSASSASQTPAARTPAIPGAAGGGAMQDWSTIMMLVSQTVDPDEWRDFGGTGSSTMIPYPNGVWLDAKGQLKRMDRSALPALSGVAAVRNGWRAGSGLRTVSLKSLDAALAMANARGLRPTAQMLNLAGITHIQYIAIDRENQDILIAGPAAQGKESGLLLEDLRTLAALMNSQTAPLGCSLDPDNQGILEAQKFLSDPSVVARLGRTPQVVADQIKAKVGSHAVNVFGIDPASSTALALVDADEHMKRVGLGLESTMPRIKTYFDHLDRKGAAPAQSLIRWWFAYNNQTIKANASGDLFELPEQVVAVMSEQQWVNAQGDRQATGASDFAADAFAQEMTEKLAALRTTQPEYARLQGIFEMGLTLQVAIEATGQTSLGDWFPNLAQRSPKNNEARQAPKSVEGVTAWDRLRNGTVVAVISGGVKMEPASVAGRSNWQVAQVTKPSQLAASKAVAVNSAATQWWWD